MITYCDYQWVSNLTYEGLLDNFLSTVGRGTSAEDETPVKRLLVVGTIDPGTGTANLQPIFTFDATDLKPLPTQEEYAMVLRDDTSSELKRYPFTPDGASDGAGESNGQPLLFVNELVPFADGTTRVEIEHAGHVVPGGSVSAGLTPPTVEILSAQGGSAAAVGETVTLSWEANDIDGDPLSFNVQYSPNNGQTWETIEQNLTVTSVDIDVSNLTQSDQARFRVVATDGIHSASSAPSAPVTVAPPPATVRITQVGGLTCQPTDPTCHVTGPIWTLPGGTLTLGATVELRR